MSEESFRTPQKYMWRFGTTRHSQLLSADLILQLTVKSKKSILGRETRKIWKMNTT